MRASFATLLVALAVTSGVAAGQGTFPFPMDVTSVDPAEGTVTLAPALDRIHDLMAPETVHLVGAYLPGGRVVDLALERLDISRCKFGFRVDGTRRPDLLDGLDLSIWKGIVIGDFESEVILSFSRAGCRGWIQTPVELWHLMPRPDENGDWSKGDSLLVSETELNMRGNHLGTFCENDSLLTPIYESATAIPVGGDDGASRRACTLRECTIAVETDWQLFQRWGDLAAITSYVTTLLTAVSDRYVEQIETALTYPYLQFYTSPNDPWTSPDSGGSSGDILTEFQAAWAGNIPAGATIGHFLSGVGSGGIAYVDVLCNSTYSFSVSGNINGLVSFPVVQGPNNWDFFVVAHELGHNFGASHTHDYCPPIDECSTNCNGQINCISNGTLMSYCYLCGGGMTNITTYFHNQIVPIMQNGAQTCLPLYSGITVDPPTVLSTTEPTPVVAEIAGTLTSAAELFYRYRGGSFSSVTMTNPSGNTWNTSLPAPFCGDTPEFYIAFSEATCGPATAPDGAPGNVFTAEVGDPVVVMTDDFESDLGWTAVNLGATAGDWERGVPVNDGAWDYDPVSDFDGSGSCYLTMNQIGNTDVDGGAVQLVSPTFDLTGGPAVIRYAYFLRLTDQDGTDKLLVEISENGTAGPWTVVANHATDGGLSWRTHSITGADLVAAGVTQTASMALRYTANDGDVQSIVEAGVDAFRVSAMSCDGPTAYCMPPNGNSVDAGGAILSHVIGAPGGMMTLQIMNTPTQPGMLFFGPTQQDLPFGCGRRCVANPVIRSYVCMPSTTTFQMVLDTTGTATVPFNIQYWYRDPAHSGSCGYDWNTSNALGY
jgi:hypothetical protein